MSLHDRPSKFFFGCLIVVLCWIIGAGQMLNRRNEVSPEINNQFDVQQTELSVLDVDVIIAPPQQPIDHASSTFYCFLASIVAWVISAVGRQLIIASGDATVARDRSHSIQYAVWNVFDFVVSSLILTSAGVMVVRALGWQFALLLCVTAIVCYFLAYGPQKIADYCRSVVRWLDQRHLATMVNGDLPLGKVSWSYNTRLILPASWWQTWGAQQRNRRVAPVGLILFGVGVIVTFGLITLFDNSVDPGADAAHSTHPPTLLSIPNPQGHVEAPEPAPKPFDWQPASDRVQQREESPTVVVPESARAPELVPLNDRTVKEGELLHVMAQVKDASSLDGRLQFQLGADAPHGATIDPDSGLFSWRPTVAGTYDITIAAVTDSSATPQDETILRVVVTAQPRPPVIARIDDRSANEGEPIVVPVMLKSSGYPQAAIRFSLDGEVPAGAVIDPDSGVFSWIPVHPGTYPISVRCESLASSKLSDQMTFSIVVNEVNEPPELAEIGNKIVRAGELLTVPLKVKNPGRPSGQLVFAIAGDSHPSAQIDPQTGVVRWDVDADTSPGEYPITVHLRNAARPGLTDQISFHVTVLDGANANQSEEKELAALELAPIDDRVVSAGSLLRWMVRLENTAQSISELEFSLADGAPDGASINSRTGLFTWRPADDQAGRQYLMTVRARDVENPSRCGEVRFSVKVNSVAQDSKDEPVHVPHVPSSFDIQEREGSAPQQEIAIPQFIEPAPQQPITPKEPELEEGPALVPTSKERDLEEGPALVPTSNERDLEEGPALVPTPEEPNLEEGPVPVPTPLEEPVIDRQAAPDDTPEETLDSVFLNSIGIHLVPIPEGVFQMGSGESAVELTTLCAAESLRFRDELPRHPVRLTRPFFMGKYEVTVGQFQQFINQTGYETEADRAGAYAFNAKTHEFEWGKQFNWRNTGWSQTIDHPVVNVSWNDALAFCRWLSAKEGRTYRLPTEAEWEYACRAGSETRYSSGDAIEDLALTANLGDESFRQVIRPGYSNVVLVAGKEGPAFTTPVGKFAPNAFGLHDMHGNVFEWCNDFYAATYYQESALVDPTGPVAGTKQVIRGGSFFNSPFYSRSSFRNGFAPNTRVPYLGFRVVMEWEEVEVHDLEPQPMSRDNSQTEPLNNSVNIPVWSVPVSPSETQR